MIVNTWSFKRLFSAGWYISISIVSESHKQKCAKAVQSKMFKQIARKPVNPAKVNLSKATISCFGV